MSEIISLLDISLFISDENVSFDNGIQYHVTEWLLEDMTGYNGYYVFTEPNGYISIFTETGEKIFENSLLQSGEFRNRLKSKIKEYESL